MTVADDPVASRSVSGMLVASQQTVVFGTFAAAEKQDAGRSSLVRFNLTLQIQKP